MPPFTSDHLYFEGVGPSPGKQRKNPRKTQSSQVLIKDLFSFKEEPETFSINNSSGTFGNKSLKDSNKPLKNRSLNEYLNKKHNLNQRKRDAFQNRSRSTVSPTPSLFKSPLAQIEEEDFEEVRRQKSTYNRLVMEMLGEVGSNHDSESSDLPEIDQ